MSKNKNGFYLSFIYVLFFAGFVFLLGVPGSALATHEELIHNFTEADCTAASGTCISAANCPVSKSNPVKLLGYCDGNTQQKACCKAQTSVGNNVTDAGCAGTCTPLSQGCSSNQDSKGTCTAVSGIQRVCCISKTTNTGTAGLRNYTLLEKIPGSDFQGSDLKAYLEAIYRLALILVTLSAVFMLSVGGFMYLTSAGNTSRAESAKSVIYDSLIGLVIALAAWLLLYVINPDLANPRVPIISDATYTPTTPGPATVPSVQPGDRYNHSDATAALSAAGIGVTSSGKCSDQNNKSCTSLEGIPKSTVAKVIKLKQDSGCTFSITGGTEVGHQTHASGRPIVDLQQTTCLKNFLKGHKTAGTLTSGPGITAICAARQDQDIAFACSHVEPAPHFHLVFTL